MSLSTKLVAERFRPGCLLADFFLAAISPSLFQLFSSIEPTRHVSQVRHETPSISALSIEAARMYGVK